MEPSEIRARLERTDIAKVPGRPNAATLLRHLVTIAEAAQRLSCEYSNFGMMYRVLPANVYAQVTTENVTPPIQPPILSPYVPGGTDADNHTILLTWQKNKELCSKHAISRGSSLLHLTKAISTVGAPLLSTYTSQTDEKAIGYCL